MLTQLYASLLALTLDWQVPAGVSTPAVANLAATYHNVTPVEQGPCGEATSAGQDPELEGRDGKWDPGFGVVTKCTVPGTVALTFDDGPWVYTFAYTTSSLFRTILTPHRNDIVAMLKGANATATFFYNGKNYGCIYDADSVERAKLVYNSGHQIASHTWSHADLTTLSWDQINNEMWKIENALLKIIGASPAFIRPPFGKYNDLVVRAAGVRRQAVVTWDFDSQDSAGVSADVSKDLYSQIIAKHPESILTLNHETVDSTVYQVIPYAIQQLQQAGYRLVSVAECLGKPAYLNVGPPQNRDPSWVC